MFQNQNYNRTISLQVKQNRNSNEEILFEFAKAGIDDKRFYLMKSTDNTLNFAINTTSPNYFSLPDDSDYHQVLILTANDLSNVKIFVDGSLSLTTGSFTSYDFSDSTNHIIGASTKSTDRREFTGDIDQVRIYNTALSSTKVSLLYKMENKSLFTFGAEEQNITTVTGTLYDKNGNAMTAACPVFAIDKDTGELLGSTTSNIDGTFSINVTVASGTKVLFVTDYDGTYNGDTDIAGAWLDTVTE